MAKALGGSVGRMGGRNDPFDVIAVQQMLNQVPPNQGGPLPKLAVDGICGPKTTDRIQKFQLAHFGWNGADGRVDPNGPTHTKLNEFDDKGFPGPKPITAQSQMACPHGGQVIATSVRNGVVLNRNDNFIVGNCALPTPCIRVQWVITTPSGALDSTSSGMCLDAANRVQGPVLILVP